MVRSVMGLLIGAPLAIAVLALIVQIAQPGRGATLVLVAVLGSGAAALMRPLVARTGARRPSVSAAVGLLAPAVITAWAAGRLLDAEPAARLAWMLGEEDNAHVVGAARELLAEGPDGAELAAQYGTSYATPGVALLRSGLAGPVSGDPRLDAVTAITASAALLPVILGLAVLLSAMALRAATLAVHDTRESHPSTPAMVVGVLLGTLMAGTATQLLIVAVPLQLGFITFAWAIAWTLVGWSALAGLVVPGLPRPTRLALAVQTGVAALLLEGSWPFLAGALAMPVTVVMSTSVARALGDGRLTRRALRRALLGLSLVGAVGAGLLATSGAVRTVLGLGREALTAGVEVGASIVTIGPALLLAAIAAIVPVAVTARRAGAVVALAVAPAGGAVVSLVAIWIVSLAIADGIVGYGGSKLLLAATLLAVAGGTAVVATGMAPRAGIAAMAIATALVLLDPLGGIAPEWWRRTAPRVPPHAEATITAIKGSSPDLPIRCRPAPGTPATTTAKVAAYFCIVWMEDAFNAGPSSGNRFAFFQTEEATFDSVVAEAQAEGLYGFAYPLRLGPGWFGWDGTA